MPTPTIDLNSPIGQCRSLVGDSDVSFPILSDDEYTYYLSLNNENVRLASVEAAKVIMFKLATQTDETVGLFQIKGQAAANAYREALKLFIKDASLNPIYSLAGAYASGISLIDMESYQTLDSPIKSFDF